MFELAWFYAQSTYRTSFAVLIIVVIIIIILIRYRLFAVLPDEYTSIRYYTRKSTHRNYLKSAFGEKHGPHDEKRTRVVSRCAVIYRIRIDKKIT